LDDTVNITIDGEAVVAQRGQTVLKAAEENGFFIPTLCADNDLEPYGACRVCVVEIEGMRGFPTSWTTPVAEGRHNFRPNHIVRVVERGPRAWNLDLLDEVDQGC
jgi:NADH dehydrogenase/NADH:ubiquinone oxidoreductase subunit G